MTNTYNIIPAHLAITAMRDSGYKNAAYAIAELVDNSIQSKASVVEIVCKEEQVQRALRARAVVKEIAIIDNGNGMTKDILRNALQFGNGERLDDRSGIGRFGMGLPNSSISQAKRVDVYSWRDGIENANHSYLDISEIQQGILREVPNPGKKQVPLEWLELSETLKTSKSGTIVIWKELDKCAWKTANAIFRNSEFIIGRIYRKFIQSKKVKIKMISFIEGSLTISHDETLKANDPLYLMCGTATPGKWGEEAMFEQYGTTKNILWEGHTISVTLSMAKKEAREGHNPGKRDYGAHASNNIGVSIMRADRELDLQRNWCISYNPVERWWGAEIDFPSALDEVFGVPNNKQAATALDDFGSTSIDDIAEREGFRNQHEMEAEWKRVKDPRLLLLEIKRFIDSNLSSIRSALTAQTFRSRDRHTEAGENDPESAENKGTEATKRRREEDGITSKSDEDETKPADQRIFEIEKSLQSDGFSKDEANSFATRVISDGRKYEFYEMDSTSSEFFSVRPKGGVILIGLNINHPAYDHMVMLMRDVDDLNDVGQLKARMKKSFEALKLLIEAWARYEDELTDGTQKTRARDARVGWGMVAREFFQES
jgi:hypothetical protein